MSTVLAPFAPSGQSPESPEPTLAECIPHFLGWFVAIRGRRPNTIYSYEKDLRHFAAFAERQGARYPRQVTFKLVEGYQAQRIRDGKKASTVNRCRYAIGSFFQFLRRQGVVVSNPKDDTFNLKEPKRIPKYLSILEQERLMAHLAESQSQAGQRNYALVATALLTGVRCEELATTALGGLDLGAGLLRVVGKGNKERECVIVPRLNTILTDYLRDVRPKLMALPVVGRIRRRPGRPGWYAVYTFNGRQIMRATDTEDEREARAVLADLVRDVAKAQASPYLFPKSSLHGGYFDSRAGQPLLTRTIYQVIRRKVAPIVGRPVHPHMLRHSFASRLRENGAPLELIQEALGHADNKTTLIYAHLSTKKRREDIARYLEGRE